MIHFGDKRREFLAKLLGDFSKLVVAAMFATKLMGGFTWLVRVSVTLALFACVIIALAIHPEGRN